MIYDRARRAGLRAAIKSKQVAIGTFFPDKPALEARLGKEFDECKKISDFVGMLTRLVFLGVAVRFSYHNWSDAPLGSERLSALIAFFAALGLTGYFALKVTSLIFDYCIKDTTNFTSWPVKIIFFLVGLMVYASIVTQASKGITTLAQATRLTP